MSIESLLFLAIFVLLPLIERLMRRQPPPIDDVDAEDETDVPQPRPQPGPRRRPVPRPIRQTGRPAPPMPPPPMPRPLPPPVPPPVQPLPPVTARPAVPRELSDAVKATKRAVAVRTDMLPMAATRKSSRDARRRTVIRALRTPRTLRSVMLLTTIMGPCRAQAPYT